MHYIAYALPAGPLGTSLVIIMNMTIVDEVWLVNRLRHEVQNQLKLIEHQLFNEINLIVLTWAVDGISIKFISNITFTMIAPNSVITHLLTNITPLIALIDICK